MPDASSVRHVRWSDLPEERVTDLISRRLITGTDMMIAHVYLKKDALVPQHSHHNEQITMSAPVMSLREMRSVTRSSGRSDHRT